MPQDDAQFYFAPLASGLQDRVIVAPYSGSQRSWQIIYLQSGAIEFAAPRHDGPASASASATELHAPAILCKPADRHAQINLQAGSSGVQLAVNDAAMTSVLGSRPEAVELRIMVNGLVALPLQDQPRHEAIVAQTLGAISDEIDQRSAGHLVVVEAQLRCLFIHLWREIYKTRETTSLDGPQTILLRRFRQLVETHYRNRWRVADYAQALNTTSDRLHNVATTVLGRAPLDLIHERSHREAKALLTRSNMTLDQIAAYLGFKTPAQFSAFFRHREAMPPGRYRSTHFETQTRVAIERDANFNDWP